MKELFATSVFNALGWLSTDYNAGIVLFSVILALCIALTDWK